MSRQLSVFLEDKEEQLLYHHGVQLHCDVGLNESQSYGKTLIEIGVECDQRNVEIGCKSLVSKRLGVVGIDNHIAWRRAQILEHVLDLDVIMGDSRRVFRS